jgi:leader peptidase (prepilin peptidase)/N-methyltransferase
MFWLEMLPMCEYDWFRRIGFNYPWLLILGLFVMFVYGSCLGSFMNVCIWRMPRNESVISSASHCTSCGESIKWYDNLPVISYLLLRGRCRHCKSPYSPRYLIVEVITGIIFAAILLKCAIVRQEPAVIINYCTMTLFALAAGWIDCRHRLIPDKLSFSALLIGIASAAVFPRIWGTQIHYLAPLLAAGAALLSGAILLIFTTVGNRITGKEVMGLGDVKYIMATAALLGLPGALFVLLSGSLSGTVYGVILSKIRKRPLSRCSIAFGPFLAAGAVIWILAGNWIWHWYIVFSSR